MDVRWLDFFYFSENIVEFFPKMIEKLVESPIFDSNKIKLPEIFEAELESQSNWKKTISDYGLFLFGRLPQDHSQEPEIAYPTADVRVSRRTGWLVYLPMEEIAVFIKHKNNNNTIYVNDHSCNFSLLQDAAFFAFPKDKAHTITFHSHYANCYSYEDIPYMFGDPNDNKIIHATPNEQQTLMYNIIGNLGTGVTGKTYIAFDHMGDRLITIKKFSQNLQTLPDKKIFLEELFHDYRLLQIERQTFLRQQNQKIENVNSQSLKNLAEIGHLNITQVIRAHFFQDKNNISLCRMDEYAPSISLKNYITLIHQNNEFLPIHIFQNIAYQILVALKYLHTRGITHSNLTPEKILLVPYAFGTLVKIRDFPLNEKLSTFNLKINQTRKEGNYFHFIAPEIIEEKIITPSADIFSFAINCYYMLTNTILYSQVKKSDDLPEHYKHLSVREEMLGKLSKVGATVSLSQILLLCLSKDPKERPSLQEIFEKIIEF